MAATRIVRQWWAAYRCCAGIKVPAGFFGRTPVYAANANVAAMVRALEQGHLGSGYVPTTGGYIGSKRNCPAGIGGKTCQETGYNCSLHNYCLAWDVEYNYNRHIKTPIRESDFDEPWFPSICKYTVDQVRAIEGIKNTHGEQMFRWLGWSIGDTMHWQVNVPPSRTTVDWNTVPSGGVVIPEGDDMFCKYSDGFGLSDGDETTRYWQLILAELGAAVGDVDGKYGSMTAGAVASLLPSSDGQQIYAEEASELHIMIGAAGASPDPDALSRGDTVRLA